MGETKVSGLPLLSAGSLDAAADFLLVSDADAALSKKIKPAELLKGAFPYVEPVFDFVTGILPPTVPFTRASSDYRHNSAGLLVSETTDVPRFDFDPATLAARGLLIEGSATNLITYSEEFDNGAWSKPNATISANATTAPDGTVTADAVIENTVPSISHGPGRVITFSAGTYVASVFAKADTRSWIYVYLDPARFGGNGYTYFNLAAGTVGTTQAGAVAFILPEANGFYRCVVIATTAAGGGGNFGIGTATGNGGATYTGDGVSQVYLWGANVVAGDALTSYIKTTGSQVTKAADVALITNPLVLTDRCWVIRARTPRKIAVGTVANTVFQVDDGTNSNRLYVYRDPADNGIRVAARSGNVITCLINLGVVANDTDFTIAARFADNNFAASLNGGAVVADLAGACPTSLTVARIGSGIGATHWNSTIRYIETLRTATDAELVLLSS